MPSAPPPFALPALIGGNVALALGPWLVRLADTGPVSAGFWRLGLAFPVLVLLAMATRPARADAAAARFGPKILVAVIIGGVLFGLDIASWHIGIGLTRLANATLFGNAGSLILMVWGFIAWRRLPAGREWLALAAALLGGALLLGRSLGISVTTFYGDLFCLAAGILYAGYLLILQNARRALGSWSLLAWSAAGSIPVLLALALILDEPFWPQDWRPVLALALSSQLIGQGLLVYALRHFSPLVVGIALLTQPAVAALIGWLRFGEAPGALDLAGIALVGSALVLAGVVQNPILRKKPARL